MTNIIYLIGYSGTGKYTIATELAKSGYVVCDNQLVNNPIFTLLNYDGFSDKPIPHFAWYAIKKIRDSVLDFIQTESSNNYVFTNVLYENEGDRLLYEQIRTMAENRQSNFFPIKLLISQEENIKRITQPARRERWKSIDPLDTSRENNLLSIVHPNLLELDVTNLAAKSAAETILKHIKSNKAK